MVYDTQADLVDAYSINHQGVKKQSKRFANLFIILISPNLSIYGTCIR